MKMSELQEIGPEVPSSLDFWSIHFPTMEGTLVWVSANPSTFQALS